MCEQPTGWKTDPYVIFHCAWYNDPGADDYLKPEAPPLKQHQADEADATKGILLERGNQYSGQYGRYLQLELDDTIWRAIEPLLPPDTIPAKRAALRMASHKFARLLVDGIENRRPKPDSLVDLDGYLRLASGAGLGLLPEQI